MFCTLFHNRQCNAVSKLVPAKFNLESTVLFFCFTVRMVIKFRNYFLKTSSWRALISPSYFEMVSIIFFFMSSSTLFFSATAFVRSLLAFLLAASRFAPPNGMPLFAFYHHHIICEHFLTSLSFLE